MNKFIFPKNAVLELTYTCNHMCKFCYCPWFNTEKPEFFYDIREELSINDWKVVLDNLEEQGVNHVGFSGGEPLLKDGFTELLFYVRNKTGLNKGRHINIISNGKLIDEELLSVFKKTGVHLQLSLPGLKTYEWHTGYAGAADTLRLINRAKEEGIATAANVIVTTKNLHELYETIAHAILAGAGKIMLNRALIGGRGIEHKNELTLNMSQIHEMIEIAQDVLETAGVTGFVGTEFPLCALPMNNLKKYKNLRIAATCAATRGFFAIDPSGYFRTCNHSTRRVGHILREDIEPDYEYWNLFNKREFKEVAQPEMCIDCEQYHLCDCGCREAALICNGSLSAPDPCVATSR